jgi:hypothetical protein
MVQFISLIDFLFTYGLNCKNKCEIASMSYFCFPTGLFLISIAECDRITNFFSALGVVVISFGS